MVASCGPWGGEHGASPHPYLLHVPESAVVISCSREGSNFNTFSNIEGFSESRVPQEGKHRITHILTFHYKNFHTQK